MALSGSLLSRYLLPMTAQGGGAARFRGHRLYTALGLCLILTAPPLLVAAGGHRGGCARQALHHHHQCGRCTAVVPAGEPCVSADVAGEHVVPFFLHARHWLLCERRRQAALHDRLPPPPHAPDVQRVHAPQDVHLSHVAGPPVWRDCQRGAWRHSGGGCSCCAMRMLVCCSLLCSTVLCR